MAFGEEEEGAAILLIRRVLLLIEGELITDPPPLVLPEVVLLFLSITFSPLGPQDQLSSNSSNSLSGLESTLELLSCLLYASGGLPSD